MKTKRIYICDSPDMCDAIIEVPGLGDITVKGELPPELKRAVEEHYYKLLDARVTVHAPICQPKTETSTKGE